MKSCWREETLTRTRRTHQTTFEQGIKGLSYFCVHAFEWYAHLVCLHQYSHKKGQLVFAHADKHAVYDVDTLCISSRPCLHTSGHICLLYVVCKVNQKQRNFHFILIRSTSVLCSLHWSRSPHCALYVSFSVCKPPSLAFFCFPLFPCRRQNVKWSGRRRDKNDSLHFKWRTTASEDLITLISLCQHTVWILNTVFQ